MHSISAYNLLLSFKNYRYLMCDIYSKDLPEDEEYALVYDHNNATQVVRETFFQVCH